MTAKHSDGFALWPSPFRKGKTSTDTIGRDLLGELMGALTSAGLRRGIVRS
jgi:alpha-L-fucosidase